MWVQKTDDRKKYILFWRKHVFHWRWFSLKKFNWFSIIHQRVYTRMMIKIKNVFYKIFLGKCFFKKLFRITLLSAGVQCTKLRWRKTIFRVNLFCYREVFSWKTIFWLVRLKLSVGLHRNVVKKYVSENRLFRKTFSMKFFFGRHCYQWGYRGKRIEQKRFILEKTFFHGSLFSLKISISLVWSFNGRTHDWW